MKQLTILLIILFISIANISMAQVDTLPLPQQRGNTCDENIRTAQVYYGLGDFEKVIRYLKDCISQQNYSDQSRYQNALVLLSKNYLAFDAYDSAKVYVEKLIELNPSFQSRNNDLIQFQLMVEDVKLSKNGLTVSSVSKMSESLFNAPASVLLITEEEIKRRGYMDLEEMLHDLPGFDISRSNGILYSHIYQRGYRMSNTNRILFLVDGVEENDLWGNIVYLSRQYPIASIKSVEVVYGPASTIYGANAFLGVISVTTKNPREITGPENNVAVNAEIGYGQWNARYADVTAAMNFPKQEIDFSFTMRYFSSDEQDFSKVDKWQDYAPWTLDDEYNTQHGYPKVRDLYAANLSISDSATAKSFYDTYSNHGNSNYFSYENNMIIPTEKGLQQALLLDNELTSRERYQDETESVLLGAKFRFNNFMLGVQSWSKVEGLGVWYNDVQRAAVQYWSPTSVFAYTKYDKKISEQWSFNSFARYKLHGYRPETMISRLSGYRNGGRSLENLIADSVATWNNTYLATRSNQVRIENRLYYTPNKQMQVIFGLENRLSAIQENYATSSEPYPLEAENADVKHYFWQDLGIFAQGSYHFSPESRFRNLNVVLGLRWDNNKIWDNEGYGSQLSPRIVLVYCPNDYVFKGIFTRAFKTPTNFDLYSTVAGNRELANPELSPEFVNNLEISGRRFLDKAKLSSVEVLAYFSRYLNSIETRKVPYNNSTTIQFQSVGIREIFGVQATADYRLNANIGRFYFWGNYTYTLPGDVSNIITNASGDTIFNRGEDTENKYGQVFNSTTIRIADIANHQINLGANFNYNQRFNFNLRMNLVGTRETGTGTTASDNPFADLFKPYAIFHASASYAIPKYGLTFQMVMNNFLDKQYYSPGLRTADNLQFSGRLPQNGRAIHIKAKFDFGYQFKQNDLDAVVK